VELGHDNQPAPPQRLFDPDAPAPRGFAQKLHLWLTTRAPGRPQADGVYMPGWPGVIVATEKTGAGWGAPWVAVTDEGSLFVDPTWMRVTDAYGAEHPWPTNSAVGRMERIYSDPAEEDPELDPDPEPEPKERDPAMILAVGMLALAALIGLRK